MASPNGSSHDAGGVNQEPSADNTSEMEADSDDSCVSYSTLQFTLQVLLILNHLIPRKKPSKVLKR